MKLFWSHTTGWSRRVVRELEKKKLGIIVQNINDLIYPYELVFRLHNNHDVGSGLAHFVELSEDEYVHFLLRWGGNNDGS